MFQPVWIENCIKQHCFITCVMTLCGVGGFCFKKIGGWGSLIWEWREFLWVGMLCKCLHTIIHARSIAAETTGRFFLLLLWGKSTLALFSFFFILIFISFYFQLTFNPQTTIFARIVLNICTGFIQTYCCFYRQQMMLSRSEEGGRIANSHEFLSYCIQHAVRHL